MKIVALQHGPVNLEGRAKILEFEAAIARLPQQQLALRHFFVDGLYVREITIPAGCALVGYIHMQPCVTTVAKGIIAIFDGAGEPVVLQAPHTMACPPGSKKAGYALADTVWLDAYVNPDNETDIPTLEARLTADTHEQYLARAALRLKGAP